MDSVQSGDRADARRRRRLNVALRAALNRLAVSVGSPHNRPTPNPSANGSATPANATQRAAIPSFLSPFLMVNLTKMIKRDRYNEFRVRGWAMLRVESWRLAARVWTRLWAALPRPGGDGNGSAPKRVEQA